MQRGNMAVKVLPAYSINLSENGQYIILKLFGDVTRDLAIKQIPEAHALGRKLGIHRYLVDATEARNVDTINGNYRFAHKDMQENPNIDKYARVAILVSKEDYSHDFAETTSRASGLNVTLFRDRAMAVRHLLILKMMMLL